MFSLLWGFSPCSSHFIFLPVKPMLSAAAVLLLDLLLCSRCVCVLFFVICVLFVYVCVFFFFVVYIYYILYV